MPEGVNVEVDGGYAYISFPDDSKRGPGVHALLETGAPIKIDTGGRRRVYIVPEGNAREAGLLDAAVPAKESKPSAPAKKAPAKKAAPPPKEANNG